MGWLFSALASTREEDKYRQRLVRLKDVGYESYELANHPEIGGMGAVEKKEETVNSFIRRKCTLRWLEKSPAQKVRDLYSKIQLGGDYTHLEFCEFSEVFT